MPRPRLARSRSGIVGGHPDPVGARDPRRLTAARFVAEGPPAPSSSSGGQAAAEVVALLPCLAAVLAALWQLVLVGHAEWAASAAARAAARAHAVGADARRAARDHLPASLERDLRVRAVAGGDVAVEVRIPALPGMPSLGRAAATSHFAPQS